MNPFNNNLPNKQYLSKPKPKNVRKPTGKRGKRFQKFKEWKEYTLIMDWNTIICDSLDFGRFFFFLKLKFKCTFKDEKEYTVEINKLFDAIFKNCKALLFVYFIPKEIDGFVCVDGIFSGRGDKHHTKEIKSELLFFFRSQPNWNVMIDILMGYDNVYKHIISTMIEGPDKNIYKSTFWFYFEFGYIFEDVLSHIKFEFDDFNESRIDVIKFPN